MSSIIINPSHAYVLIGGMVVGKFANLFSGVVIAGLVLYIVTPNIYTYDRMENAKNYFQSWFSAGRQLTNNYQTMNNGQQMLLLNENRNVHNITTLPEGTNIKIVNTLPPIPTTQNTMPGIWSPIPLPK